MGIFEDRESEVRSYCRAWPKIFDRAAGSWLYDEDGRAYLEYGCGQATTTIQGLRPGSPPRASMGAVVWEGYLWKSKLFHVSLAR